MPRRVTLSRRSDEARRAESRDQRFRFRLAIMVGVGACVVLVFAIAAVLESLFS